MSKCSKCVHYEADTQYCSYFSYFLDDVDGCSNFRERRVLTNDEIESILDRLDELESQMNQINNRIDKIDELNK